MNNQQINITLYTCLVLIAFTPLAVQAQPVTYVPPPPANLTSEAGSFWVNHTWQSGTGNTTDSYNISVNGTWYNSTTDAFRNSTTVPHGWVNITVWAYNSSGTGSLSEDGISQNTQAPNNLPFHDPIGNKSVSEGQWLNFTVHAIDTDNDTITYSTNATKGTFDITTGDYSWLTNYGDAGIYVWYFNSSDGYGVAASETIIVTVSGMPLLITDSSPVNDPISIVGTPQTFTINLNRTANIIWYINGSVMQTDSNATSANYTNSTAGVGVYNVTAVANDSYYSASKQWNWTVNSQPVYAPDITSWSNSKTNNNSLTLAMNTSESANLNATANQTITTWNWYLDGVNQNNNYDNFTISWNTSGTKSIQVNATNSNGTSNTITWTVTIQALTVINQSGIRIIFNDSEFYFNASNGGEITEYYDLTTDPLRNRNLANINIPGRLQGNLWPLFTSAIYNPYTQSDYSTGGDPNATVSLIEENNDHIVLYVTSRMMNRIGSVVKNIAGYPVYINTTWTFNKINGLIFVEKTFNTRSSFNFPAGWRWYPFYFTRNNGFKYNGTFYFFNATYAKTIIINNNNYVNKYNKFPVFPNNNDTFGIAMPFSNTDIEGDGTHNVIIVYNYDKKTLNVSEWKSDTSNIVGGFMNITWAGAVHEFSMPVNVTTHTYNAVIHFTHQAINKNDGINYARYVDSLYPFIDFNLITDRDIYHPGDTYTISASGVSYYNLNDISSKLTAANDGGVYFERQYNSHNYTKGDTFSYVLFNGYILPNEPTGYRTFTLQFVSQTGAIVASDSKTILITN